MSELVKIAFGCVLRQVRKEAGMSQEVLGLSAGLQRKYISLLELGEKQPTITSIFKLSEALNLQPSKLVEMVESHIQRSTISRQ